MPDYFVKIKISKPEYARVKKGGYTKDTKFTDLELREIDGLSAIKCVEALSGMFIVLSFIDLSNPPKDLEHLTLGLRNFAELGSAIADNAYASISECLEGYDRLMKKTEHSE